MSESYLNALPSALIAVNPDLDILFMNAAAENFFGCSIQQVKGRQLSTIPGFDADLIALCARALDESKGMSLFEHKINLLAHQRHATIHLSPVMEPAAAHAKELLITLEKADGLDRLAASEWKQEATRTAGVMAAMLAHEVKNPLSGIRGAAQLLRDEVTPEHQPLTDLICLEVDRVRDLLAQVEVFAGGVPGQLGPVNIHEVLQYVISIATTGFAAHVHFRELYDPSLPLVLSHRDLLVQLFLNLIKNSAEALVGLPEATITVSTSYRSGYRFRVGKNEERVSLPLLVSIEDNGAGVPESIRDQLFEPFMSSKEEGRGLGLAIVAKIASDLGAVVELDQDAGRGARFVVSLACAP
jgi:two-component system nitrogen regulation sensor histidine kinase GlnL